MSSSDRLYDVLFNLGQDIPPATAPTPPATTFLNTPKSQDSTTSSQATPQPYRAHVYTQSQDFLYLAQSNCVTIFKTVMRSLFLDSWTVFLESEAHVQNLKSVQLYLESARAATSSEATAMAVDDLPLPKNDQVEAIVTRAVNEKTKSLQAEIFRLRTHVTSKNVNRGALKSGASSKKKKTNKAVTYKDPIESRGKPAADSGKGSRKDKASSQKRKPPSTKKMNNTRKTGRRYT